MIGAVMTFEGTGDRYNGVTVDSQSEICDVKLLPHRIKESFKKWKSENKRCIWFKVDIKDSAWVPILAEDGFNFHHARENFVMMYKWLPTDSLSNLPPACHTNLGVGGLVFNDLNQILAVTEQHFNIPHWKLPGGYVERGEDVKDAVIREVKEETGIDAVFDSMVTLRHTHNAMFGNSDIYIVIMLKATSNEIVISENEIKDCKWMDIDEYLEHPHVHEFNRFIVKQAIDLKNRSLKMALVTQKITISTWSRDMTALVLEDIPSDS